MRRKNYIENKGKKDKKSKWVYFIIVMTLIIFVALFLTVLLKVLFLPRFSFVYLNNKDQKTEVYVVDSKKDYYKKYVFSDSLLVESSMGYGEYNLKSLWTLSKNEKVGGKLIASTIVKNFNLPIYYYLNSNNTNMDFIHLLKSKIVLLKKISDETYIDNKNLSRSVLVDFVYDNVQESGVEVSVDDQTGNIETGNKISDIVDVLGSKVVEYKKGYDENLDCEIYGNDKSYLTVELSRLFGCNITKVKNENNKVILKLGAKFSSRF